jgi:uncharacterized membrane protein YhiD involved in acid resistance
MDDNLNILEELLNLNNEPSVPITGFIINVILTGILAYLLGLLYVRYGSSLSNRRALTNSLLIISLTTMVIITIVKSSLALSLGLVGALSIVRFRTAIKEPEELAFFFVSIAIGLGLGAEQRLITIVGVGLISGIIVLKKKRKLEEVSQNLIITMTTDTKNSVTEVIDIIKKHSQKLELKRLDESQNTTELSLLVEFLNLNQLIETKDSLKSFDENIQFNFLENK